MSAWGPLQPFRPDGGWGIRLATGPFARPISFGLANPWSKWCLFTLRLPWIALPFVSYSGRRIHFYFGGKQFPTGTYPDPGHAAWMRPKDANTTFVTLSARLGWGVRS